jgi:hypothetical protein
MSGDGGALVFEGARPSLRRGFESREGVVVNEGRTCCVQMQLPANVDPWGTAEETTRPPSHRKEQEQAFRPALHQTN